MDMRLWKTFNIQKREGIAYYNTQSEFETEQFALHLNRLICEEMTATGKDGVMFLCIGTDRSTGDSLGPLIGHKLRGRRLAGAAVIGTLDKPVHAMNLDLYARYIKLHYPDYVVVAIDASVGSPDHVGYATLGRGARSRDPVMLQSVRLSIVMKMADCICEGICLVERLWDNAAII